MAQDTDSFWPSPRIGSSNNGTKHFDPRHGKDWAIQNSGKSEKTRVEFIDMNNINEEYNSRLLANMRKYADNPAMLSESNRQAKEVREWRLSGYYASDNQNEPAYLWGERASNTGQVDRPGRKPKEEIGGQMTSRFLIEGIARMLSEGSSPRQIADRKGREVETITVNPKESSGS